MKPPATPSARLDSSCADATALCTLRTSVLRDDRASVREIVASTGFFSAAEVDVAVELVDDRLARGEESDYHFIFADREGRAIGYACYGPIACTAASFDLYWVAVHQVHRGAGLGRRLMAEAERLIAGAGGRRIYVETSSRPQYEPTRHFYERCGYRVVATLDDFYAPRDNKIIFVKVIDAKR